MTSRLRVTGYFGQCTEWPQNNLEHYKVKCTPYMHNKCSESQISLRVALPPPAVFELHAILRQVLRRMTLKWPWTVQSETYAIHVLLVSQRVPNLVRVALWPVILEWQAILTHAHWMPPPPAPQMTLNTIRSKVHHICVISVFEPQITSLPAILVL